MNCRHCGSDRTMSKGIVIKCKDCNRTSTKIQRRAEILAEDRPICPDCDNSNPYSRGIIEGVRRWVCRSCGRQYASAYAASVKDKVELPTLEVQIE